MHGDDNPCVEKMISVREDGPCIEMMVHVGRGWFMY